jgi:hypothetical protein
MVKVKKPRAFIDQWVVRENTLGEKWLEGKIDGHERQFQFIATIQSTSAIIREDYANNEVETLNTIYTLGKQFYPFPNRVFP